MACRFTDTGIWDEDWFIALVLEHQHLWNYIKDQCNHAGIWKPNKSGFEMRGKTKVNLDSFFLKVNGDKERILRLKDGSWFITGFIKFQWFNKKDGFDLSLSNKLHSSIYKELIKYSVPLEKVRGLQEVLETSKEMVKEKDKGVLQEVKEKVVSNGEAWNTMPGPELIDLELPDINAGSVEQHWRITKRQVLTREECLGLWQVFKIQYLTGKKFYGQVGDVFSHFINWTKTQKIDHGTDKQFVKPGKSSGAEKLTEWLKQDVAMGEHPRSNE